MNGEFCKLIEKSDGKIGYTTVKQYLFENNEGIRIKAFSIPADAPNIIVGDSGYLFTEKVGDNLRLKSFCDERNYNETKTSLEYENERMEKNRRTNKSILVWAVIALIAISIISTIATPAPKVYDYQITLSEYNQLKIGMTRYEVVQIVGSYGK